MSGNHPSPRHRPPPLTRADWVRLYDEATVAWWELTPQERWRQASERLQVYLQTPRDGEDGLEEDGTLYDILSPPKS